MNESMGGIADLDALADEAELRTPAGSKTGKGPEPLPAAEDYFSSDGLVVEKLASAIQREGHVAIAGDGRLYRYRRGVWVSDGDTFSRVRVREILGRRFRRRHVDEVMAWLRAHEVTIPERPPAEILNVTNGILRWQTGELRPHGPDLVTTIQLPVAWTPGAGCERFETFLAEVLPAEAHAFVFEMLGYLIFTGNPLRVAVLLLGPGRNGKSTLLAVIVALLGAENVATVPLQMLAENRFAAAELYGRLANVCGDLDARAIKHTDTFKMLTGGDRMMAERKHAPMFSFRPFAVPVFSANEPPISSDQTEAWFDRWVVLPMEHRLSETEVDPRLAEKLTTRAELEGILVRAVEGLQQLMARGRFELPDVVKKGREDYREQLDTVAGFIAEDVILDPTLGHTPRADLYKGYRSWCTDSGRLPVAATRFYARLRDASTGKIEDRTLHGVRGFAGIRLRIVRGAG